MVWPIGSASLGKQEGAARGLQIPIKARSGATRTRKRSGPGNEVTAIESSLWRTHKVGTACRETGYQVHGDSTGFQSLYPRVGIVAGSCPGLDTDPVGIFSYRPVFRSRFW